MFNVLGTHTLYAQTTKPSDVVYAKINKNKTCTDCSDDL